MVGLSDHLLMGPILEPSSGMCPAAAKRRFWSNSTGDHAPL